MLYTPWNKFSMVGLESMNSFEVVPETQVEKSSVGRGTKSKSACTRRSWSFREEEILMYALKELVALGWKFDNGFRLGYLSRIEEAIKKEFLHSDLKGNPHNDPNARFMRYKSWPLWNDWKMVFDKDRASGDVAHDTNDAFDHLFRQTHVDTGIDGIEVNGFKDYSTLEIPPLNEMQEDTNLRLDRLTDKISYDFDVSKSQKEVFEKLGAVPGLTLQQQIDAAGIILDKVERLDLFMSLLEVARCTFVMTELERNGFI
ncbi:hypothetical protein SASPL_154176 [Salvia splendens]|uniref:Myb/SANT-like domain-containing protein n=1 Tax=Salvia splendens TaxID=180675 RepID=A0A8X8VZP4_SALSN|nr:hypothetical protein SASPL_154176 [Salvia splendens]